MEASETKRRIKREHIRKIMEFTSELEKFSLELDDLCSSMDGASQDQLDKLATMKRVREHLIIDNNNMLLHITKNMVVN